MEPKIAEKAWNPILEKEILKQWINEKTYEFIPKENNFTIDTPPPYPSGRPWHIGAAAHYSQIDMKARTARMAGKNVYFPIGIVAERLRHGREEQHLDIYQVAEVTKIKTDHIRALEAGDYDAFTAPARALELAAKAQDDGQAQARVVELRLLVDRIVVAAEPDPAREKVG